jgi:hypothetical protein
MRLRVVFARARLSDYREVPTGLHGQRHWPEGVVVGSAVAFADGIDGEQRAHETVAKTMGAV